MFLNLWRQLMKMLDTIVCVGRHLPNRADCQVHKKSVLFYFFLEYVPPCDGVRCVNVILPLRSTVYFYYAELAICHTSSQHSSTTVLAYPPLTPCIETKCYAAMLQHNVIWLHVSRGS